MPAIFPQFTGPTTSQGRIQTCPRQTSGYDLTHRMGFGDHEVNIFGWPSKGGVIVLDYADAIDLEFLGLDPLNPPAERLPNQTDEDNFCQRLLLLGAKWWESRARFSFLARANEGDALAIQALEYETVPIPTMRERCFVSVGWPTTGGLWVAEFDTTLYGIIEDDNLVPFDITRLRLARTMDERCELLRDRFNATFYKDVRDYKGHAFLNSWQEKETRSRTPDAAKP